MTRPRPYDEGMLTDEQVARYERDGFLVIPDFVDAESIASLRQRALELVDVWEPGVERTVFTTEQQERVSNHEFLSSGDTIWCFFEEEAFGADGMLTRPKELSINKIGHAMHDLDPTFERFSYTSELAEVAGDIGLDDAVALQSMYIFKQPSIGGEVGCHQDATFLYTEPVSVTGFWFALEDATLENGCLWAAPGGHRTGLRQLFKRAGTMTDDDGTEFEVLDPTPLPTPTRRTRPTRGDGRHPRRAQRAAPPLERRQPVGPQPTRVHAPLHLRSRGVPGLELAAAARRHAPATSR